MKNYKTDQENFWNGEFGNEYINRNKSDQLISASTKMFADILSKCVNVNSVIEFGANVGLNISALRILLPDANLSAVEINSKAVVELKKSNQLKKIFNGSIIDYNSNELHDLVLVKGVLIHIARERLHEVYCKIYQASKRYILLAEYYNPTPVEISYRGHSNKLCKRDFAGEMLDLFNDLHVIDYGFVWHRDCHFPQDDATWFLLEKRV